MNVNELKFLVNVPNSAKDSNILNIISIRVVKVRYLYMHPLR